MKRNLFLVLPPLLFAAFAAVAWFALQSPDEGLPTAFAGREAPSLAGTSALREDPPPDDAMLGRPGAKLLNFWASWCAPCRAEHPILTELAESGVPVIGVNYKDQPGNALGFLAELGDPYIAVGADPTGRTGIDWGLYGVPETFVVDGEGRVVLRHAGPITPEVLRSRILPAIEEAGSAGGAGS